VDGDGTSTVADLSRIKHLGSIYIFIIIFEILFVLILDKKSYPLDIELTY